MQSRLVYILFISALLFWASFLCHAGVDSGAFIHYPDRLIVAAKSLEDAAKDVRKRTGCKVVSAKESKRRGKSVYKIKVLCKDGTVKVHTVKANNG